MSEEEAKTLEESERQRDEAEILAKSQDPLKMLEDWWKPVSYIHICQNYSTVVDLTWWISVIVNLVGCIL